MVGKASHGGASGSATPRWARRLERLVHGGIGVLLVDGIANLWAISNDTGVENPLSEQWRAQEAALLEWGMPHLRNCTADSSTVRGIEAGHDAESEVHVVYSADAKMFAGLLTSMLSLARSLERPHDCSIHLVIAEEDYGQAAEVVQCFQRELESLPSLPAVRLHRMRPLPFNLSAFDPPVPGRDYDRNPPQMFVRWYLHEYLHNVSRVLWLDADTLVRADVAPLLRRRAAVAAARGPLAAAPEGRQLYWRRRLLDMPAAPRAARLYEEVNETRWFNAGVLVIDLDAWRRRTFSRPLDAWLEHTRGYMGIQMVLNLEFEGGVEPLDWTWNLHSLGLARYPQPCLDRARILHAGAANYELFEPWECNSLTFTLAQPYEPARLRCGVLQRAWRKVGVA